jgi:hypothetical protein
MATMTTLIEFLSSLASSQPNPRRPSVWRPDQGSPTSPAGPYRHSRDRSCLFSGRRRAERAKPPTRHHLNGAPTPRGQPLVNVTRYRRVTYELSGRISASVLGRVFAPLRTPARSAGLRQEPWPDCSPGSARLAWRSNPPRRRFWGFTLIDESGPARRGRCGRRRRDRVNLREVFSGE